MDLNDIITFSKVTGGKHDDIIERTRSYLKGMQKFIEENWSDTENDFHQMHSSIQNAHKCLEEKSYEKLNDTLYEIHNIYQKKLNDDISNFWDEFSLLQRQIKRSFIPDDYKEVLDGIKKYLNSPDFTQYDGLDIFRSELLDKKIGLSKEKKEVDVFDEQLKKFKKVKTSEYDIQVEKEKKTIKHRALIPKFESYLELGDIENAKKVWFNLCQNVRNAQDDRREYGLSKQVLAAAAEKSRLAKEDLIPIQEAANKAREQLQKLKPNSKITKTDVIRKMKKNYEGRDPEEESWIKAIQRLKVDSLRRKFKI